MYIIFIFLFLIYIVLNIKNIESFEDKLNVVVVVPCIPKHLKYLQGLFKSINNQTLIPTEVIVVLSETNDYDCKRFESQYREFLKKEIKLNFKCVDCKNNSAQNRNRAIDNFEGIDFISYIDADDEMCDNRLKRVTNLMITHNAEMALHSFSNEDDPCKRGKKVILPDEIKKIEKKNRDTLHISEILIHHGHITIRPNVIQTIKQDPNFGYGEDSKFVRDVIRKGFKVVYTDDILSHYYFSRSYTHGK
jgi:glycosyltransferase involved in cell wall biosynthesis